MSEPKAVVRPDDLAGIEQLEVQFDQIREGLAQSHRLTTLGMLASRITQEYNNILAPTISYGQMALASPGDLATMRKAVEKTLGGAERVARISASLLGLVCETDEIRVARIPAVVNDAIACMARDPKQDGIDLVLNLPDVSVAISPLKLQQVLLILILNATQAMRGTGGELTLAGHVRGGQVYIDVTDTGPGICENLWIDFLSRPVEVVVVRQTYPKGRALDFASAAT